MSTTATSTTIERPAAPVGPAVAAFTPTFGELLESEDAMLMREPSRRWVGVDGDEANARFVYVTWLMAAKHVDPFATAISHWLELHVDEPDAHYVYVEWLRAGGDRDAIASSLSLWLSRHATIEEACWPCAPGRRSVMSLCGVEPGWGYSCVPSAAYTNIRSCAQEARQRATMSRHSTRDASELDAVAATRTYRELIERLRSRIRESQARAARALNTELVMLYWSIGHDILDQQKAGGGGDGIVERIADDLREATGGARGFSRRNLFYMRRFAALWPDAEKVQPLAAQIGWTHHQILLDAFPDQPGLYAWYAAKSADNRWPRRYLKGQIDLKLHERQGVALNNFALALEPVDAEQALQAMKDPYVFEFLELAEDARERELEQALIDDVQKLLLELGTGFAFYGRQKALLVGDQEFFLDLLFYHHALRRFVIVDLKVGEFKPEHISKMNFYLNAVDEQLRLGDDRESVGIILCTGRDETVAKLALHRVYAPIAVSTWQAGTAAPSLPPVEIADDVPEDLEELSELDTVRVRLIERVAQHATQTVDSGE